MSYNLVTSATGWLIPIIMGAILIFGYLKGVKVYEAVRRSKEGFQVAMRIIPFMVAILWQLECSERAEHWISLPGLSTL